MINTSINGNTLKELRKGKGLTQSDLSVDCSVDKDLISKLELGKRPAVSLCTVVKLANFFDVTIETLLR